MEGSKSRPSPRSAPDTIFRTTLDRPCAACAIRPWKLYPGLTGSRLHVEGIQISKFGPLGFWPFGGYTHSADSVRSGEAPGRISIVRPDLSLANAAITN